MQRGNYVGSKWWSISRSCGDVGFIGRGLARVSPDADPAVKIVVCPEDPELIIEKITKKDCLVLA